MLLVTGGIGTDGKLNSTEVYYPSAGEWKELPGAVLPRLMYGVRVATLDNKVLLFGEMILLKLVDIN